MVGQINLFTEFRNFQMFNMCSWYRKWTWPFIEHKMTLTWPSNISFWQLENKAIFDRCFNELWTILRELMNFLLNGKRFFHGISKWNNTFTKAKYSQTLAKSICVDIKWTLLRLHEKLYSTEGWQLHLFYLHSTHISITHLHICIQ